MNLIEIMKDKVMKGALIEKNEVVQLITVPLEELCSAADDIRKQFCGDCFDMCSIINGKMGNCLEDCKYCAQNIHYKTNCTTGYPLLPTDELLKQAKSDENKGVLRYSIVTSGKRLSNQELNQVCETIKVIKEETNIKICASFGLLNEKQFRKIKAAGVSRVHCNLESSKNYFNKVCTTHTYNDRVKTLNAARKAGLSLCSGGIMGLGESMSDRIDMVFELRNLGVKSIPVNLLIPIQGTPYENNKILSNDELCKTVAIFRFIIPDAFIRLAGGRELVGDKGEKCFKSGANAVISGDMLTTAGITVEKDMQLLDQLGYTVRLMDE